VNLYFEQYRLVSLRAGAKSRGLIWEGITIPTISRNIVPRSFSATPVKLWGSPLRFCSIHYYARAVIFATPSLSTPLSPISDLTSCAPITYLLPLFSVNFTPFFIPPLHSTDSTSPQKNYCYHGSSNCDRDRDRDTNIHTKQRLREAGRSA
jgi:hypothetical protein